MNEILQALILSANVLLKKYPSVSFELLIFNILSNTDLIEIKLFDLFPTYSFIKVCEANQYSPCTIPNIIPNNTQ